MGNKEDKNSVYSDYKPNSSNLNVLAPDTALFERNFSRISFDKNLTKDYRDCRDYRDYRYSIDYNKKDTSQFSYDDENIRNMLEIEIKNEEIDEKENKDENHSNQLISAEELEKNKNLVENFKKTFENRELFDVHNDEYNNVNEEFEKNYEDYIPDEFNRGEISYMFKYFVNIKKSENHKRKRKQKSNYQLLIIFIDFLTQYSLMSHDNQIINLTDSEYDIKLDVNKL